MIPFMTSQREVCPENAKPLNSKANLSYAKGRNVLKVLAGDGPEMLFKRLVKFYDKS